MAVGDVVLMVLLRTVRWSWVTVVWESGFLYSCEFHWYFCVSVQLMMAIVHCTVFSGFGVCGCCAYGHGCGAGSGDCGVGGAGVVVLVANVVS